MEKKENSFVIIKKQSTTKKRSSLMDILSRIADAMQGVLTETADIIASETGFVKRHRKVTGSKFVQTLVFGWLDNPDATLDSDRC